jgi:electron transfer flavoprotein beta subunit
VKIVVCVKQVAVLGDEIEFAGDGRDVDHDFLDYQLNEWDAAAVEEALRLREAAGAGEVVAVTVGDDDEPENALRRALAMGADRAVRVASDGTPGDPIAVARALAAVLREEAADLVLCGVQSGDHLQGSTGTALAALADLPCVAVVKRLEYDHTGRRAMVDRELEGGLVARTEVMTPALLTIQTGINSPRYATLRAIKEAERREIAVVEEPAGAPSARLLRMYEPDRGEGAEMISGAADDVARRIAEIVKERLR